MRSNAEHSRAMELVTQGKNDCEVARATGIPRTTIRGWRRGETADRRVNARGACPQCGHPKHDFAALPKRSYAYLLGMYLGDGHISRDARSWRLRIALGTAWPGIIDECLEAMQDVFPHNVVSVVNEAHLRVRCRELVLTSAGLPIPATWTWQEAFEKDRARTLAGGDSRRSARAVLTRAHTLRRLPVHEPGPCLREGLRIPEVHLLQCIRRYTGPFHRRV
jgi:hypothetical protein